jgi:hypothetical protein
MSLMMRCASALILLIPLAIEAQTDSTTHKVDITLTGADCVSAPDVIQVVVASKDRESFPAYRDKAKPCRWTGEKPGAPFRITDTLSVRLAGARSDCRLPSEVSGSPTDPEPVGQLTFPYNPGSANQLTITTEKAFYVSYVREMPAVEGLTGSRRCREEAFFRRVDTVSDVAFEDETLRLRFALVLGHPDTPWVMIDDVLWRELLENSKKSLPTILLPEKIGSAVVRQTPLNRVTPNTGDSIAANLKAKGMKSVTLTVQ